MESGQSKLAVVVSPDFEEHLKGLMKKRQVPGCTIALVQRNGDGSNWQEVVRTYGSAGHGRPVTSNTRFPIASNTKLFTVLTLAKLLEENGYTFDTRIQDIVPEFQMVNKDAELQCTVADICAHLSGVPGYNMGYAKGQTKHDIFKLFGRLEPSTEPRGGQSHQYSNIGYDVLGYLIEYLSKDTYRQHIRNYLLDPLGLTDAGFILDENTAKGYRCDEEEYSARGEMEELDMEILGDGSWESSGGLIASAQDMDKWMKAFPTLPGYSFASTPRSTDPGWSDTFNYPHSSSVPTYGAGLYQTTYKGITIQEHWGLISGYRSLVLWIDDAKLGLTVMTNGSAGEDVVNLIKMIVLDEFTGGQKVGLDEWTKRFDTERQAKTARITSAYPTISSSLPVKPIIGTFRSPGQPDFILSDKSFIETRPQCVTLPFRPQLYGDLRPILCYLGGGKYEGCFELTMRVDGKISYGSPFQMEVEEGVQNTFRVYGLSDVGHGVNMRDCPAVFRRVVI
ncbi:hypothetical protein I302_108532 [Kwoniella bestiolae CBS 10118]|uniref:Beta-lactamase-related domain-containing protein n=1 Tax=Kwoniella bestiolae CBS 10118 TaxID=1296100 RepID=A0A1B9FVG7_9TREE|nr:hypothetical protein I302_07095 [Kwoniella bestiolae CBS 10118]OCF22754.1 hypothetical protein I302_07095 [Kwoniella bestiolae CBS 10118]